MVRGLKTKVKRTRRLKPRLYKQNPDGARVEDKGNSNYVILFIYPLESAEADIVCVGAVSTAVFSFILTSLSKIVNFTDNYRSARSP